MRSARRSSRSPIACWRAPARSASATLAWRSARASAWPGSRCRRMRRRCCWSARTAPCTKRRRPESTASRSGRPTARGPCCRPERRHLSALRARSRLACAPLGGNRMLLPLLAALAAASAAPAPDSTKAFPFPVEMHVLPNGLRVAFITYDSPGLVAYYTLMRVGSRNEVEKGKSGFAHFFEHMMFRGTKNHPADDYNQTVTRLGLNTNAFTSEDMTVYHLYGPSKALPTIIEYEADRFQNLFYDEPAFRTEAGAILGEYIKSASNPEQKLYEKMMETAFTRHTYAHTVIGYLKDVENMPSGYAYSREFFRRYYTPDNATLFVAGDFDKAATLAQIQRAYGGWKGKADPMPVPAEPRQRQSKRAQVAWDKPTLPRLWIAWHTSAASDIRNAALQNLLNAYLFGPTSPLYQDLVLGKQLVDSMYPTYGDHRDPNLFGVLLRVKDAKSLKAVSTPC